MSYLRHVENCNRVDWQYYIPFMIDGIHYGHARRDYVPIFVGSGAFQTDGGVVSLSDKYSQPNDRTCYVRDCLLPVIEQGDLPPLWGEDYPVVTSFDAQPAFCIDRTLVPFLGVRAWGCHLNGYTQNHDGDVSMWIGRRAADKKQYPNMLDNMVAGGLPFGISPDENMKKEMNEEAGIGTGLHSALCRVGAISYTYTMNWTDKLGQTWIGMRPDTMITYDLNMPGHMIPKPVDGEVAEFMHMPIEHVLDIIHDTDDFKFNCNLVILDFAIRHGIMNTDNTAEYNQLLAGLLGK